MSTQGEGPDLDARLRAADPAATAEPDLRALRAAVDARITQGTADGAAEDATTHDGHAPGRTDELAAVRARRVRWSARAASVAAAALVVGAGGGYAVGAMGGGGPDPAEPALTLVQPEATAGDAAGAGAPSMSGGATAEIAPGAPVPMSDRAASAGDMATSWAYGGRAVFHASGLSGERRTGHVWGFDVAAVWSPDTLGAVAAALGVAGEPQQAGSSWRVGPEDGTGPTAELYADGTASFWYFDPTKDPWRCDAVAEPMPLPAPDEPTSDTATDRAEIMPVEPCAEQDLGPAPSGDAAIAVVRDVMADLGVDPDGFELTVEGERTGPWTYVSAHQVVDGRRTGVQWNAGLTGAGLSSLNGQLAPLVDLGEYDVVSPAEAVERLMDPRFSSGGPMGWVAGREPVWDGGQETPSGPPATPRAGTALRWPVEDVTIVEATLGSAMHWSTDATLLVPTYELVDSRGAIWTVIAVADEHLDMDAR